MVEDLLPIYSNGISAPNTHTREPEQDWKKMQRGISHGVEPPLCCTAVDGNSKLNHRPLLITAGADKQEPAKVDEQKDNSRLDRCLYVPRERFPLV